MFITNTTKQCSNVLNINNLKYIQSTYTIGPIAQMDWSYITQPPISRYCFCPGYKAPCILHEDGCQSMVTDYFNNFTAICATCVQFLENKLKSSPFPQDLCPCCHQSCLGPPFSLCKECLTEIESDGYADSTWGSWHLDRRTGKMICIGLDFE